MNAIEYIDRLIQEAIERRASDIHIEPQADALLVRARVDGILLQMDRIAMQESPAIVSRLKVMSDMDIGERRLPQDGAMTITTGHKSVEIRLSTLPVLYGEKIVMRLFHDSTQARQLHQLGMEADERKRVENLLYNQGLIVVTGSTGVGKTTTLYALLQSLNRKELNVSTLEDPVEFPLEHVNQVQIHPKAGLSFAHCLRAMLRQDPDVIMIGEIRDYETAEIAIRAALTGHLILTTLHARDGIGAVTRLMDMGLPPYMVAAAINGVIAQKLVRVICSYCHGRGCEFCHGSGFSGRTGLYEVLAMDEEWQSLILKHSSPNEMRAYCRGKGMSSLKQALEKKVSKGQTTMAEGYRVMIDEVEG